MSYSIVFCDIKCVNTVLQLMGKIDPSFPRIFAQIFWIFFLVVCLWWLKKAAIMLGSLLFSLLPNASSRERLHKGIFAYYFPRNFPQLEYFTSVRSIGKSTVSPFNPMDFFTNSICQNYSASRWIFGQN